MSKRKKQTRENAIAAWKKKKRREWKQFKKDHPEVASERLEMLRHFKSI